MKERFEVLQRIESSPPSLTREEFKGQAGRPAGLERRVVSDPAREFSEEVERLTDWCGKNALSTGYRPEAMG